MSADEINRAIAETCGWRHEVLEPVDADKIWLLPSDLPDYCNDLNAMHEAEMTLPNEIYDEYWNQLVFVCMNEGEERMNSASAKLRAKAFAITIGKWKE